MHPQLPAPCESHTLQLHLLPSPESGNKEITNTRIMIETPKSGFKKEEKMRYVSRHIHLVGIYNSAESMCHNHAGSISANLSIAIANHPCNLDKVLLFMFLMRKYLLLMKCLQNFSSGRGKGIVSKIVNLLQGRLYVSLRGCVQGRGGFVEE